MYYKLKQQSGMAAIFTVLVISAAALIMARSAAFLSMNSLDTAFVIDKEREVEYLTEGCVEESIRRLQLNHNYTATDLVWMLGDNSCKLTVGGVDPSYLIDVVGTVGDYHKNIRAELSINNDQIIINKWSPND